MSQQRPTGRVGATQGKATARGGARAPHPLHFRAGRRPGSVSTLPGEWRLTGRLESESGCTPSGARESLLDGYDIAVELDRATEFGRTVASRNGFIARVREPSECEAESEKPSDLVSPITSMRSPWRHPTSAFLGTAAQRQPQIAAAPFSSAATMRFRIELISTAATAEDES